MIGSRESLGDVLRPASTGPPALPAWGPGDDAVDQWYPPCGLGAQDLRMLRATQSRPKVPADLRRSAGSKPPYAATEGLRYLFLPGYAHGEAPREPDRFAGWWGCGRGHQG